MRFAQRYRPTQGSFWLILLLNMVLIGNAHGARLKDITDIAGVRTNALIGYGLVVGLDGTGDQTSQTPFTIQTFKNMMAQFGITVPENVTPQLKNVAAVSIHAQMNVFQKPGQFLDVTVSSIGNAKSLRGGEPLSDATTRSRRARVCDRSRELSGWRLRSSG